MSRSSFAIAGAIGVVTTFAIAGCGTSENAQIVGVPPAAQVAQNGSSDTAIAGFRNALADQLRQAAAPGVPGTYVATQINALASDTSLIAAERMDALKSMGATAAAKLDKTIASLFAATAGDSHLAAVSVDGQTVASRLFGLIGGYKTQVDTLAAKIAADTLIDVLRTDNVALASTHVSGLLDPQAHLLIAAGDTLYQSNSFAQTIQQLGTQISAGSASDPNYNAELGLLGRLRTAVTTIQATAVSVVRQAGGLTSAGFPANQGTLLSQQQALAKLNASGGALATASGSIDQIRALLAQRP